MEFSRRHIANILEENISIFYGGVSGLVSRERISGHTAGALSEQFCDCRGATCLIRRCGTKLQKFPTVNLSA